MVRHWTHAMIIASACMICFTLKAQSAAPLYKTNKGSAYFFSETPLENIEANSSSVILAINPSNRQVAAVVPIQSFQFNNALMQEHFNEKYMESEKYPNATFSGTLNETIDFHRPGTYNVSASGKLTIHGIAQQRTLQGKLTVYEDNTISLHASFDVKLENHRIEVPTLVIQKIAETIRVTIDGTLSAVASK